MIEVTRVDGYVLPKHEKVITLYSFIFNGR